jgi:glutamate dehydrogenase
MSLNMFVYGQRRADATTTAAAATATDTNERELLHQLAQPILEYAQGVQSGRIVDPQLDAGDPLLQHESLVEYLGRCRPTYVQIGTTNPSRFLVQRLLFDQVSGTEGTAVHIGADTAPHALENHYWVDVAVANSMPQVALENLCRLLYHHEFDVSRARLDVVPDGENGNVTILRTLISPTANSSKATDFDTLTRELKRAKWLDPETNKLVFDLHPWLGITRGEILTAFGSLLHPILAKVNPLAYSKANILERIAHDRFIGHAAAIADVFLERFKPTAPLGDEALDERLSEIASEIENDVEDTAATEILLRMMDIVRATLKTNIYMPERYALGLRLDPTIMGEQTELPYGVFFIHGRRFNGFHVRFRDISRGGLRLVTPANSELYALESARQYDECYGLAFAQQMKNKDMYVWSVWL